MTSRVDSSPSIAAAQDRASLLPGLIGGFLLIAAWLKILAPAEAASVQSAYDIPYGLVVAAIQLELVIGLLLISRLWAPWVWGAAVALFASFALISLLRALAGLESCGCFGAIRVNPWATFTIDVIILASLLLRRGVFLGDEAVAVPPRSRRWLVAWVVMAIGAFGLLAVNRPERLAASTLLQDDQRLVILEPSEWIGESFPLRPYLRPDIELTQGQWIVVMYHHDCPKCQSALPEYERLASEPGPAGLEGILAVEVPPFGPQRSSDMRALTHARLSDEREWFVQAPVELVLRDGVVVSASLELPSIARAADEHPAPQASK